MNERLFIVGGSVRAAAMSAKHAGFQPIGIDRFADVDLRAVCDRFRRFEELQELSALADQMPAADWIYTGPLENEPDLVEELSRQRRLLGIDGAMLRQLRDPWRVADALEGSGLRASEVCPPNKTPIGGNWLKKPLYAAGGFGIERVIAKGADCDDSTYFQKLITGRSVGATFVAAKGMAVLVGVTRQLLGPIWGGAREFQYVGSVGPVELSPGQLRDLAQIGICLAENFSVQGLFGIDAIINDEGVWPVEVNPRYTASIEILERTLGLPTIQWHVTACREGKLPEFSYENSLHGAAQWQAKAIVYAEREFVVNEEIEQALRAKNRDRGVSVVADIPVAGMSINRGAPVATVFVTGSPHHALRETLQATIAETRRVVERG